MINKGIEGREANDINQKELNVWVELEVVGLRALELEDAGSGEKNFLRRSIRAFSRGET